MREPKCLVLNGNINIVGYSKSGKGRQLMGCCKTNTHFLDV